MKGSRSFILHKKRREMLIHKSQNFNKFTIFSSVKTKIGYLMKVQTDNSAGHFTEETGYLYQQGFRKFQEGVLFQILVTFILKSISGK